MKPSKLTSTLLARKGTAHAISAESEIATLYRFPAETPAPCSKDAGAGVAPRSATEAASLNQSRDSTPRPDRVKLYCTLEPRLYLQLDLVSFAQNRSFQETLDAAIKSFVEHNLPAKALPLCEHLVKARKAAVSSVSATRESWGDAESSEKE